MPYRALRTIKKRLQTLTLHDTWRTLHPNERDFTFYSSAHNKYTRIDHFFISQKDLPLLSKATIDPMILSDHNPVSISLEMPTINSEQMIWRLDNSLLTDIDITQKLNTRLMHFFTENTSTDSKQSNVWAAHKCVIRGEIISLSAHRNKTRRTHIALLAKIHALEQTHKLSLATSSLKDLIKPERNFLKH